MRIQRQLCDWYEPSYIANKIIEVWGEEGFIWLDGDSSKVGRWAIIGINPTQQICCKGLPKELDATNPFEELRCIEPGYWAGWLSYEAGAWIEPSNPWKSNSFSTLWIGKYDSIFKFDLHKKELWIEGCNEAEFKTLIAWIQQLEFNQEITTQEIDKSIVIPIEAWEWLTTKSKYQQDVKYLKEWIASGDIFQANLSACCITELPPGSHSLELFQNLRKNCPAPFSGLIIGGKSARGESIISVSPERFLNVLNNGEVETRPIKGTRPRQIDISNDCKMAIDLVSNSKDRAENIMIVDLLRNDLGRVCQPGSIHVPQLVSLESYSQVHHLTSIVKGKLKENQTWLNLLEACWPGGSISGAPKLRACKRLHDLEPIARGPYCGSLIQIDWYGNFDSNILIRTLIREGKTLKAHAGCGIVADSDPYYEAEELSWKLLPLLKALDRGKA